MKKNYPHNVIRLRKGKRIKEQTYWIIAILNRKKVKSLKILYKIGYFTFGLKKMFVINLKKLAFFLNKGFILKKSVKKIISLIAFI
jgi:ribosomal protein S16